VTNEDRPDDRVPAPPDDGGLPEDPYADVETSELPEWWREAIERFEAADLHPYQPPRFNDGATVPSRVLRLERELDVDLRIFCVDPQEDNEWKLAVDGDVVSELDRQRSPRGFTVFELSGEEFEELVRASVS